MPIAAAPAMRRPPERELPRHRKKLVRKSSEESAHLGGERRFCEPQSTHRSFIWRRRTVLRRFFLLDFRKNGLRRHEGEPQSLPLSQRVFARHFRRQDAGTFRKTVLRRHFHQQGALADFTRPIATGPLRPKSLMGRTRKCEHQKIPHPKRHHAHARKTLAVQALNGFAVMQEVGRWATRTRKAHGRYRRSNA